MARIGGAPPKRRPWRGTHRAPNGPPMTRDEIRRTLQGVAREVFEDDGLEIADSLGPHDVRGWDSLGHIRLISATEEAFGITFTLDEIEEAKSMGQIVAFVSEKA